MVPRTSCLVVNSMHALRRNMGVVHAHHQRSRASTATVFGDASCRGAGQSYVSYQRGMGCTHQPQEEGRSGRALLGAW